MQFEVLTDFQVGVFYQISIEGVSGYVLYPIQKIPVDSTLVAIEFEPTSHLSAGFKVWHCATDREPSGDNPVMSYLFYSKLPIKNYGTGVMSFSKAWQRSSTDHTVKSDQVQAVFRNEHFYMYEAPTIATLITGPEVSEDLNDYLTMI